MEFTWRGFRGSIEPHWVVEHPRLKTFRRLLMDRGGLYARLYASAHGSFDDLPGEGEDRADRESVAT